MIRTTLGFALVGVLVAGCSEDPQYITPAMGTSFSMEFDSTAMTPPPPVVTQLPFRLEKPEEVMKRTELATQLMMAPDQIPFIRLDDVDLSIEWSIKNLLDCDAQARFAINGANQYFSYDPAAFADPTDPDAMAPPPLIGNMAPIDIPANATVSGVFREDQIREAAIDLELITRASTNPFKALLEINKNDDTMEIYMLVPSTTPGEPPEYVGTGVFIPKQAWAQLIQFDVSFSGTPNSSDPMCGSAHMVMEWEFRARDHRGVVHDHGMDADPAELTVFTPTPFAPTVAMP